MSAVVETWFGDAFAQLHPLLQALHRSGGSLYGTVDVRLGTGLAGWVGRRLAQKLGVPPRDGTALMRVSIYSTATELHWDRTFNETSGSPQPSRRQAAIRRVTGSNHQACFASSWRFPSSMAAGSGALSEAGCGVSPIPCGSCPARSRRNVSTTGSINSKWKSVSPCWVQRSATAGTCR